MQCPRCSAKLLSARPSCLSCGFDLAASVSVLGHDLVGMDRLTDAAHCLRLRETRELELIFDDFERRFPQIFVAVYFGVLPDNLTLGELTFWLLNHAAFNSNDFKKLNEYAIVMIIDPISKSAALNVGYALEGFLDQKRLQQVLNDMKTSLWHAEYVDAIRKGLDQISKRLKKKAKSVSRSEAIIPPDSTEEFLDTGGLQALRRSADGQRRLTLNPDQNEEKE